MAGEDRRKFMRSGVLIDIRYKLMDKRRMENDIGSGIDISAGGIRILTPEKLAKGSRVELEIGGLDKFEPFVTKGEAVWSKKSTTYGEGTKNFWENGIRFTDIDDQSQGRIGKYVYKAEIDRREHKGQIGF